MFGRGERVLSVTQLNEYVRKSLAADPMLGRVSLRGEIGSFKRHTSGHLYFMLKDDTARINCVMFRQHAQQLTLRPSEGMRVVLGGQVSIFVRDGQYQFYAEKMRPDGVGELYLRFEALKQELLAEGLFDPARKRELPLLPSMVGVVTSPTGAAVRDIIRVAKHRNPGVHLLLAPAKVQGDGAAEEVAEGMRALARIPEVDVIIVGRGGGSMEDLWAFNEESLARAIAACPKPVISAVGHETDTTISDYVADVRAATPSAAAMLAVPEMAGLRVGLQEAALRMRTTMENRVEMLSQRLTHQRAMLSTLSPAGRLANWQQRLAYAKTTLTLTAMHAWEGAYQRRLQLVGRLTALGPMQVLRRGYAYVSQEDGVLAGAAEARLGPAEIRWWDGSAQAELREIRPEDVQDGGEEKRNPL